MNCKNQKSNACKTCGHYGCCNILWAINTAFVHTEIKPIDERTFCCSNHINREAK